MPITTKNHQLTPNESLNQPPPQKAVAAVVDGKWNLAGLLDLGRVYKKRRESIPADADPALYVGNYLYAITQKGFSKPPSFWAASRLSEGKLAGDVFNELADLPPERLALILRWSADPFGIALVDELLEIGIGWRSSWQKGVDADKVRQAIAELGLSEFIPAAAPEPSTGETTDLDRWLELVGKFQNNPGLFMHLSGSKFINANGAVRIEVADERIKQVLDRSWPIIGPKLKRSFPEKELIVEVRK